MILPLRVGSVITANVLSHSQINRERHYRTARIFISREIFISGIVAERYAQRLVAKYSQYEQHPL